MTYQDILNAERAIEASMENYAFRCDVSAVLAAAEDNATDDAGRIESIRILLSFPGHELSAPWFAQLGIKG